MSERVFMTEIVNNKVAKLVNSWQVEILPTGQKMTLNEFMHTLGLLSTPFYTLVKDDTVYYLIPSDKYLEFLYLISQK